MSVLDVIVPGLLGPFSADLPAYFSDELKQPEFKVLNTWLSRARVSHTKADAYYASLQSLICPQCDLSVCQLTAEFDQVLPTKGHLYRIDPVHFKAESDHAVLLGTQLLEIELSEAQQLIDAFNNHFIEDEVTLYLGAADRWYLQTTKPLELSFNSIDYSLGRDIKHFMPQGDDALWWRKILNEAQMLFFQHGVNQQREENRQLSINGLWLWDESFSIGESSNVYNTVYTNDVFASALANKAGSTIKNNIIVEPQEHNALVIDDVYEAVCYGDVDAWLTALRDFCQSHLPIIQRLLNSNKISGVNIYPCDGRVFYIDRWQLLKFWKWVKTLDVYVTKAN